MEIARDGFEFVSIESNPGGGNPGYLQPSDDLEIDN